MPAHEPVAVPAFLYGTAWKEDRTEALTELALRSGFRGIDTANQRRHYFEAGRVGADGSRVVCGEFKSPPEKAGGTIIEDEDTNETVEKILAWLDERKLI